MSTLAEVRLTVDGVEYVGTGETVAEAAQDLARQLEARIAVAEARWRPTPAGEAYLARMAGAHLAALQEAAWDELKAELQWEEGRR